MRFTFEAELNNCPGLFALVVVHSIRDLYKTGNDIIVHSDTNIERARITKSISDRPDRSTDCNDQIWQCCRNCNLMFYVREKFNGVLREQFKNVSVGDALIMEMHLSQDRSYDRGGDMSANAMSIIPKRIIANLGKADLSEITSSSKITETPKRRLVLE